MTERNLGMEHGDNDPERIKAALTAELADLASRMASVDRNGVTSFRFGDKPRTMDEVYIELEVDDATGEIELIEPGTIKVHSKTHDPVEAAQWVREQIAQEDEKRREA
ncbi:MAG: hypothetical protein V1907_01280 [Candidatus Kerfeldbacteria bacterium]